MNGPRAPCRLGDERLRSLLRGGLRRSESCRVAITRSCHAGSALIADCFTGRLRYSGASLGYQLASIIAGGPAPLIATALFAAYKSGYAITVFILGCAVISLISASLLPDYTGRDISAEYDRV